jgi:hypothetical protein
LWFLCLCSPRINATGSACCWQSRGTEEVPMNFTSVFSS